MFDMAGHGASSTLFRVDRYFDCIIVNAENTVQTMCRAISEIISHSILIPRQIHLTFLKETQVNNLNVILKKSNIRTQNNTKID